MSDTDEAQQPETSTPAQQSEPAQESQQQTADLPDEAANADQYLHWSGRSADPDKITKK